MGSSKFRSVWRGDCTGDRTSPGRRAPTRRAAPCWCHGGVLATKVRYFGVKSTKEPQGQMGTKPAKVAHRPSWPTKAAKPGLFPVTEDLFAKRSSDFAPRADQSC
eukprot:scaffold118801_cov57-Phaeocystis_antarctica.AAC.2